MATYAGALHSDVTMRGMWLSSCQRSVITLSQDGACVMHPLPSPKHSSTSPTILRHSGVVSGCTVSDLPPVAVLLGLGIDGISLSCFNVLTGEELPTTLESCTGETSEAQQNGVQLEELSSAMGLCMSGCREWVAIGSPQFGGVRVWRIAVEEGGAALELWCTVDTERVDALCITPERIVIAGSGALFFGQMGETRGKCVEMNSISLAEPLVPCGLRLLQAQGGTTVLLCTDGSMHLLSNAGELLKVQIEGVPEVKDVVLVSDGSAAGRLAVLGTARGLYLCDGFDLATDVSDEGLQIGCVGSIMNQQCVVCLDAIQPDCVLAMSETAISFWLL
eukprot:TRINITY_DN11135_c0_g1_i7.p1 TRINITY_DN11135_c0_g1~~TRINITY_DN11135_c0_g1_i7.p1  ORF type:complete len:334 (+),score=61.56 TRINITY_DN11135_c0_g1_i7:199-1200(+)